MRKGKGSYTRQPGARPLKKEIIACNILATLGYDTVFLKPINEYHRKTADINLNGEPAELKIPEKYNAKTVKNQFKTSLGKGASTLIISTTENGASVDDIARDVQAIFDGNQFAEIKHVLIIDGMCNLHEFHR